MNREKSHYIADISNPYDLGYLQAKKTESYFIKSKGNPSTEIAKHQQVTVI